MKRFIYSIIVLTVAMSILLPAETGKPLHYFSAGPYFAMKGGVNGGYVLEGRKNGASFNGLPDFGVSLFYPMGENSDLGFTFDLGYSTYSFDLKSGVDEGKVYNNKFSYVSLSPNFHFSGFLLGFNFGLPVSASFGEDIDASKLSTMVEVRLGGLIPLLSDDSGTLNLTITGGYMLTGIYKDFVKDDPLKSYLAPPTWWTNSNSITDKYNPKAVSISIGLSYLFNL